MTTPEKPGNKRVELTHEQWDEVKKTAQALGSLKDAVMAHAVDYGIEDIDWLFPEAKTLTNEPEMYSRDMEWVAGFMKGVRKSPFSRVKSMAMDITADEARAKGYVKGSLKKDEVVKLLKRSTTPTMIYKKQKLDRQDIIDITDFNVVAMLKREMRIMLNEEIARAMLVGDGRDAEDDDKVNEDNIRPIWTDDDLYAHKVQMPSGTLYKDYIKKILLARKEYRGSGSPVMYTTNEVLTELLLLEDTTGRRLYSNVQQLASALRVSSIIEVPVMEGLSRESGEDTYDLVAIIVNLRDYVVGADKGGEVSMFDDFDIDYNQYKYLMETYISGGLVKIKSALVVEKLQAAG